MEETTAQVIPPRKPRIVEILLLISLGLNIFLFGIFVAAVQMATVDEDKLAGREPVVDTIYVHYMLHAEGEKQYTMLAEDSKGKLALYLIPIPLRIHTKYQVLIDRNGITVKSRIKDQDELPTQKTPKGATRNSARISARSLL